MSGGPTVLTRVVARLLLLPICMIALGILVTGYTNTGDGFSAGVIVALGIALQYLAFGAVASELPPVRHAPRIAQVGLLLALGVAFFPVLLGDPIMTQYPAAGQPVVHLGSLELMTPVLFDVGVFLLVLGFVAGTIDIVARAIVRNQEPRS